MCKKVLGMSPTSQPTVLIVDDTPQNIHLLRETLRADCRIMAATSGAKALEMAGRVPRPDLILLDVMMPEMDGYEVCEELKADPETSKIPVMFVTALSELGDEERGLALGAVDYITKPFHPALVRQRVHNQLELKRHRDSLEEEVKRRTEEAIEATLAREKLESELAVARALQSSLLASRQDDDFGVGAALRPARAVGGDLYEHHRLDSNRLLVAIGDVSDKGVAASLFMVRVLTLLRHFASKTEDVSELLSEMNQALCEGNDTFMFVTLVCCVIDTETGEWQMASGGHEHPVVLGEGVPYVLDMDSGPALGLLKSAKFPLQHGRFSTNSSFLFYTDGITDAVSKYDDFFGSERLLQACDTLSELEPSEAVERVFRAVDLFSEESEQYDDMTLLYVRGAPRC